MLSLHQAAIRTGMRVGSLAKLLEQKGVPDGIRTPCGDWRVSDEQIEEYMSTRS